MLEVSGILLTTPSDLVAHTECSYKTLRTHRAAVAHESRKPVSPDLEAIAARGDEHEQHVLASLEATYGPALWLERPQPGIESLKAADAASFEAMASGAPLIYQPTFYDNADHTTGRADFLVRVELGSHLGPWSYEVIDAKLARTASVAAALQSYEYSRHVARLQGITPVHLHIAGPERTEQIDVASIAPYAEHARAGFYELLSDATPPDLYPLPVEACARCPYAQECADRRRGDDHLSLVANIRKERIVKLARRNVTTVTALASMDPGEDTVLARLVLQARLQVASRTTATPAYEVLDTVASRGLARLPEPAFGDVYFDFESDPFIAGGGLEYLIGACWVDNLGVEQFRAFWAHDRAQEAALTGEFLSWLVQHLTDHPGAHAYHYAPYERTALRKLTARHNVGLRELGQLEQAGAFVDLFAIVSEGLAVGTESYSIKKLEPMYGFKRTADVTTSQGSITAYEDYLKVVATDAVAGEAALDDIEQYNHEDCTSTRVLRDWLWARRIPPAVEVEPEVLVDDEAQAKLEDAALARELEREERQALADGLAGKGGPGDAVLAGLISWYAAEQAVAWGDYFRRLTASQADLHESADALVALELVSEDASHWHLRYPDQDHKLRVDKAWDDAATRKGCPVVEIDRANCRLKVTRKENVGPPTTLVSPGPLRHDTLANRFLGYARCRLQEIENTSPTPAMSGAIGAVLERRIVGPFTQLNDRSNAEINAAIRQRAQTTSFADILEAEAAGEQVPAVRSIDTAINTALALDGGYLAIQGPPGTGKTWTGARIIARLLSEGKTVGLCGPSHRAIDNLLYETITVAAAEDVTLRAIRKVASGNTIDYDALSTGPAQVRSAASNGAVASALAGTGRLLGKGSRANLVAGTSWLYCAKELVEADIMFDYLVIDEAGQFPLVHLVATGQLARNIILLGDPQQLPQVEVAEHGEYSSRSALGHISNGATTLPPEYGLFLDSTRRMSMPLCTGVSALAYGGRLRAHESVADRHLLLEDSTKLAGVYTVMVPHEGSRYTAPEEVDAVSVLVAQLLGSQYVDDGHATPLTLEDIVVIAPYNAHVDAIRARLEQDYPDSTALVGTVDKFQGLEAAVAIYTMGPSSPESLARGPDFLFSTHRLNVALSRGKAAAFVLLSPQLLNVRPQRLDDLATVSRYINTVVTATPHGLPSP